MTVLRLFSRIVKRILDKTVTVNVTSGPSLKLLEFGPQFMDWIRRFVEFLTR